MPRYVTKSQPITCPISERRAPAMRRLTMMIDYSTDHGETGGRDVHEDGTWSEDQPTGILTADGDMIYRVRNSIGFLADN